MREVVCAVFVLTVLFSLVSSRDLVSPGKFYLASFLVFYVGAFAQQNTADLWSLILIVLLVGTLTVVAEAGEPATGISPPSPFQPPERPFLRWLWGLSLPAIAAQLYIVYSFGGLAGYLAIVANRVVEFRGMGVVKTLAGTMFAVNLAYLALGLTRRRSAAWWGLYWLHVVALVLMGLLSGSRGGVLNVFALQLFIYHYLRRRVQALQAGLVGGLLVLAGVVLGVLRDSVRFSDEGVSSGLEQRDSVLSGSTFNYGVEPLRLLTEASDLTLAYGTTFVSAITNVVPRALWPTKPDTGGVWFTKVYTNDAWDGASNLTPTLLGEFVMNFGWFAGIVGFFICYTALMVALTRRSRTLYRTLSQPFGAGTAIDVTIYTCVLWAGVALMTGEVTNVVVSLVLTQLLPLYAMRRFFAGRG